MQNKFKESDVVSFNINSQKIVGIVSSFREYLNHDTVFTHVYKISLVNELITSEVSFLTIEVEENKLELENIPMQKKEKLKTPVILN